MTTKAKARRPLNLSRLCRKWRGGDDWPQKIAVMRQLVEHAWDLVHRLIGSGVKFAGTPEQATLTVAGTAYAAWRLSIEPDPHREIDDTVLVAEGITHGIEFALWYTEGIPALFTDDYARLAEQSECEIDRIPPMKIMAKLWPEDFTPKGLKLETPELKEVEGDGFDAQFWDPRPNILTTPVEDVRKATRRASAKWKRVMKRARKSKAK